MFGEYKTEVSYIKISFIFIHFNLENNIYFTINERIEIQSQCLQNVLIKILYIVNILLLKDFNVLKYIGRKLHLISPSTFPLLVFSLSKLLCIFTAFVTKLKLLLGICFVPLENFALIRRRQNC